MIDILTYYVCFFCPSILKFYIMRYLLFYLATLSTAIASPFVDLGLPASSLGPSASQGSEANVPETDNFGPFFSPALSGLDSLDTNLLSLASSGSAISLPNTDSHAADLGTGKLQNGDLATTWYLQPLLWIPACETEFPGTKPYCCDKKIDKDHTAKGCDHCRPLS